jgi:hypothetical protein
MMGEKGENKKKSVKRNNEQASVASRPRLKLSMFIYIKHFCLPDHHIC